MMGHVNVNQVNLRVFDRPSTTSEQRYSFYSTYLPHVWPDSKWRQYRLLLESGQMKVLKKITSAKELQSFLIKHTPVAVYETISCWLEPEAVTNKGNPRKGGSRTLSNCFLYSDFLVDLDAEHCTLPNVSRLQQALIGYEYDIIVTGHGYHFRVRNWYRPPFIPDPIKREAAWLKAMRAFANNLQAAGVDFDFPVSCDTRRIARVPGTLHQNGTVCRFVSHVF